jgi:hypothetical protein
VRLFLVTADKGEALVFKTLIKARTSKEARSQATRVMRRQGFVAPDLTPTVRLASPEDLLSVRALGSATPKTQRRRKRGNL